MLKPQPQSSLKVILFLKTLLTSLLLFVCAPSFAQEEKIDWGNVPPEMRKELEEKFLFEKVTYRLFVEKKYDSLIAYSTPYLSRPGFSSKAQYSVLAGQYFRGNVKESDRLLKRKIPGYESYLSALDLLSEQNIALLNYFEIDSNRLPITQYVLENYQKEHYPEKQNG